MKKPAPEPINNRATAILNHLKYRDEPITEGLSFGFPALPQTLTQSDKIKDESAKYAQLFDAAIQPYLKAWASNERNLRIEQRKDYAHVIPPSKRYSSLPLHEELGYQLEARLQQMTPEEHEAFNKSPFGCQGSKEGRLRLTTADLMP